MAYPLCPVKDTQLALSLSELSPAEIVEGLSYLSCRWSAGRIYSRSDSVWIRGDLTDKIAVFFSFFQECHKRFSEWDKNFCIIQKTLSNRQINSEVFWEKPY